MKMLWELFVCIGVSWGGCGAAQITPFPDEKTCTRSLETMVVKTNGSEVVGGDGRQVVAYCRPKS